MVRLLTAYTFEADEFEVALAEILEQLDIENNCLNNSAAFLFCHPDFISTGVAQGIAAALPFEVAGATTVCNLTQGLRDLTGLTVSVMTSDTVEFTAASLSCCNTAEDVVRIYKKVAEGRDGVPSLIFPLASSVLSGDLAVTVLNELTDGQTPLFGSNVIENNANVSQSNALHNGLSIHDGLVLIVAWGELNAKFFVSEIDEKSIQEQHAVITKSNGHIIMSINDLCPADYLESIGISDEQANGNLKAVPFVINLRDGTKPVVRAIFGLTPEGYIIASGAVSENATISVGSLNEDDVARITDQTIENALSSGKSKGMLFFPCVSHFWMMESSPFEIIQNKIDCVVPYQVFYSGGEICPVYDSTGKLHNRYHSFTCIACSFE